MKGRAFYILFVSFFAGILAASYAIVPQALIAFAALCGAAACCISLARILSGLAMRGSGPFFVGLSILAFSAGLLRFDLSREAQSALVEQVGQEIVLAGVIASEPARKETTQSFVLSPDASDEKILVVGPRYPRYEYGDRIEIVGTLAVPENFETYEGGPVFDYVSYLGKDGIRFTMYRPDITVMGKGEGNRLRGVLISVKGAFSEKIEAVIREPSSSLLLGLLVGEKHSLGESVADDFRAAGLSHIVVLSGYNVSIVAESFMRASSFLPRALGQSLGALSIVLFALMTGASATTVRASLMALLLILARNTARKYDIGRALVLAGFFMVLHNPRILAFDVSFQLSFLATIAIIYVAPLVESRLAFVTSRLGLREIAAATVATQAFVLPYVLHTMGMLSLVSLPANILVLPAVPLAMAGGFCTSLLGFLSHALSVPAGWISEIILSYILAVAHLLGSLPFASVPLVLPLPIVICCYAAFAYLLRKAYKKRADDTSARSPEKLLRELS